MKLAPDVDLERIAASIPGSTGADIALLVNEAALFAARREHPAVEQRDFTDAIEKIILGAERQVVMTDADRRRTAYHESGPRPGGDVHPRRRPGAEGVDHPLGTGSRRHPGHAGERPLQLPAR